MTIPDLESFWSSCIRSRHTNLSKSVEHDMFKAWPLHQVISPQGNPICFRPFVGVIAITPFITIVTGAHFFFLGILHLPNRLRSKNPPESRVQRQGWSAKSLRSAATISLIKERTTWLSQKSKLKDWLGIIFIIFCAWTVDGSEIRRSPLEMHKNHVNNGITSTGERRISEPSTGCFFTFTSSFGINPSV